MKNITLVNRDSAIGTVVGSGSDFFKIDGYEVAVDGDRVASHSVGEYSHGVPTLQSTSNLFFINDRGIIRIGDAATCGDRVTGSSNWFISD